MYCVYRIGFLMLFGQAFFLVDNILSSQLLNEFYLERLECNISCTDRLNASNSWEPYLKGVRLSSTKQVFNNVISPLNYHAQPCSVGKSGKISSRTPKAADAVVNRRVVDHILMDDNIVGEMHLDVTKVNTDSQAPLQINIDSDNDTVSGYFFNFHDHKPTFKVGAKDKARVALTGGLLSATYIMDQFHFHVYCTRSEAEDSTLDKSQVPGELHIVFFRETYKSYNKAVHRFQDGLAVIAINLEVRGEESKNHQVAKFSSFVDYISRDQYRTVFTTASVKQLAAPVFNKHAQYDAYRGNLVEPIECENCVDVFLLKEQITVSVKQMTEFRKGPHCVENDWGF